MAKVLKPTKVSDVMDGYQDMKGDQREAKYSNCLVDWLLLVLLTMRCYGMPGGAERFVGEVQQYLPR